jgi:hypothetical protein
MSPSAAHALGDLTRGPGELSFEARISDEAQRVWFRTETDVTPHADAALAACLMPAMTSGGALRMSDPVSPRLLRNQREFQAIQRGWSKGWRADGLRLETVEVEAPPRTPGAPAAGRVAALFSGGVDSWWTVLEFGELTDLVFVRGFDLTPHRPDHARLTDEVEERLRGAAGELDRSFHVVETNVRQLSDPLLPWDFYFGSAAAAVALLFSPLFERAMITGDSDYEVQERFGANWLVDQLLGSEELEIVETGGRVSRMDRLRRIAPDSRVQSTLRVCWQNPGGAYNCGRCRKCLMTMIGLEAIGLREAFTTFPRELDLEAVAQIEMTHPVTLTLWEDLLDASRMAGRRDLERASETVVENGKRGLGLPQAFRRRRRPGPPPVATRRRDGTHRLLATPATAAAVGDAGAVALQIGGYDGSGNLGDLLQLDATLELLEPFGSDVLALPVLERAFLASHRELAGQFLHPFEHAVFFDADEGEEENDGLIALPVPAHLDHGLIHLYGGGYLNPTWGPRKLAMLKVAEGLLDAASPSEIRRVASGVQVEPGWLDRIDSDSRRALERFDLLCGRDAPSREAFAALDPVSEVLDGGDDAIGVLHRLATEGDDSERNELCVNVHFAGHDWIGEDADSVLRFHTAYLTELAAEAKAPIRVRPLIAYLDRRVDERPAADRLIEACSALGIEAEEPELLRPAALPTLAPRLTEGVLTLSCSYHVALTSLMLGVPTVLLRENRYYEQKAAGLAEAFGAPPGFAAVSSEEAGEGAAELVRELLDPARRGRVGEGLRERAGAQGERRGAVEKRLLGKLGLHRAGRGIAPRSEIVDLCSAPGELSFEARLDGGSERVWFRTDAEVRPSADAALAACLVPAMVSGGTLRMSDPVSPRLLRNQREYQAIQRAWSVDWEGVRPLREVAVEAPLREPAPASGGGRVAAFFSGGVDSFATVLANPEVTDLIFVRGLDLIPGMAHQEKLGDEVERRLRAAAADLGLPLHVVETNVRELSDPLVDWGAYNPGAMAAVALLLAPLFERVLIASDTDHATQVALGSGQMIDQLWSTEEVEIADDGGLQTRQDRLRALAEHPVAQRTLRVCWENRDGAYNCGRCPKCLLTTIVLEALGVRDRFETFPPELDLGAIAGYEIHTPIQLVLWEDTLEAARRAGRPDLARAVEPVVASGKRALGLPDSYRSREDGPPAPRRGEGADVDGELQALRAALREAEARAEAAEARAEGATAILQALTASRSWRLTEPLRRAGAVVRRRRAS